MTTTRSPRMARQDDRHPPPDPPALSSQLALGPPLSEILARVCREVAHRLDAERAYVLLSDTDVSGAVAWPADPGLAGDPPNWALTALVGTGRDAGQLSLGPSAPRSPRAEASRSGRTIRAQWLREPLMVAGRTTGMLVVLGRPGVRFERRQNELFWALADEAAVGIENNRLFQDALERAERMRLLADMSRLASESLDVRRVQGFVVRAAGKLLGADLTCLWLLEDGGESFTLAASATGGDGGGAIKLLPGERLRAHGSIVGQAVALGRSVYTPDLEAEPLQVDKSSLCTRGLRSQLVVPLLAGGRSVGALSISHRRTRCSSADELEVLEAFAAQAVAAIENARLYGEASRRRDQAEAMAEIAGATTSSLELREVLALALEKIIEIMAVPSGIMYLREEASDVLNVAAHRGLSERYIASVDRVLLGEGALGRVAATGVPELLDDVVTHPNIVRPYVRDEGLHSMVIVPLQARERVIGAVYVAKKIVQPFTADQTALLVALGRQVAVAIENASLHGAALRRGKELAALLRATRSLMTGLDLQVILKRIVEEAAQIGDVPHVEVLLVDERAGVLRPGAAVGLAPTRTSEVPLGVGFSGTVAATGQPLFVDDIPHHPARHAGHDPLEGVLTYLGLPIRVRERVVGVLAFNRRDHHRYDRAELDYLSSFADQAAIAIENARLFEQVATVEALRELARLKTEFLSTVSHELRTPLSLIVGYSELLVHRAEKLSPQQVADMAGEISSGSGTMMRLVDDLLDFSRLEQGRIEFRMQWVDVTALLRRRVESFRSQEGGDRIRAEIPNGLEAYLDPERFAQIVNNLLTNALRYAPAGPIQVKASRGRGSLRVEVVDQGPGIAPEDQARVWEKFYRGPHEVSSPVRGSGVGLSVVKTLVEVHGGSVGLRSEVDGGSTFWFTVRIGHHQSAERTLPAQPRLARGHIGGSSEALHARSLQEIRR